MAFGQPQQLGDDLHRQRHREWRHDVDGRIERQGIDEHLGGFTGGVFERAHHATTECGLHEIAIAGVLRRVGMHHGGRIVVMHAHLEGDDAATGAERGRVGGHRHDLGVTTQNPERAATEIAGFTPGHRIGFAQLRIEREGVLRRERVVEQLIGERFMRDTSGVLPRHWFSPKRYGLRYGLRCF